MYLWASTTRRYFDMVNKLQALLPLLTLQAAVVQLNSAFHHVPTAYTHRRKDIIQWTAAVTVFSCAISRSRSVLINLNEKVRPHVEEMTTMQDANDKLELVREKLGCKLYKNMIVKAAVGNFFVFYLEKNVRIPTDSC